MLHASGEKIRNIGKENFEEKKMKYLFVSGSVLL